MSVPALATLQRFRDVERDQKYTDLVDIFADDALYYDPFHGPQRGREEIAAFMAQMEESLPRSGAGFTNWQIGAGTHCGWAEWDFVVPSGSGASVTVPGQSLYRLRDGAVTFVADYIDNMAYARLGDRVRPADHVPSLGLSASSDHPRGAAADVMERYWELWEAGRVAEVAALFDRDAVYVSPLDGTYIGRDEISAFLARMKTGLEHRSATGALVDIAADDEIGWSQWQLCAPNGAVPGWTLFTCRDERITYIRPCLDAMLLRRFGVSGEPASAG